MRRRRRITGTIHEPAAPVLEGEAVQLSAGVRDRRRSRREPDANTWLREAAWDVRGTGRVPRWRT